MATAASSSILQSEQQQAGTSSSSSAWQSSGSIGPFFAVMSVLAILAAISCYFGRTCEGRPPTPLESIRGRGCFGRLRRYFRTCGDVEVGGVGARVMVCDEDFKGDCEVKDGDDGVSHQNLPHV